MNKTILMFFGVICSILLFSCGKEIKYNEYSYRDLIDSETSFLVKDTLYNISMLNDFKVYNDSLVIFTDFYNMSMFKYDLFHNKISAIGKYGKGPGEYLNAFGLLLKNDLIYYSDADERGIECFDLNGNNPRRVDNVYLSTYTPKIFFTDSYNTFYFLNEFAWRGYFVFSSNGKNYGKTLKIFTENKLNRYPFAGAYVNKNKLYFMYMIESKIYYVNFTSGIEGSIRPDIKGFYNWEKVQNEKMTREMNNDARNQFSRVGKFLGFEFNGRTYFYISVYNKKFGNKNLICNEKGKILFSIKDVDPYGLEHISNNKCYAYSITELGFQIKSFKWNSKFKELLISEGNEY